MPHHHIARLGVIGCGQRAIRAILPILRHTPSDLVAVTDQHSATMHRVQRHFGARRSYRDFREMLEKEILDAVIVGDVENSVDAVRFALHMAVPVLLTTPSTLTAAQAADLVATADAMETNLGLISWPRFDAATAAAHEHIQSGVAGTPVSTAIRAVRSIAVGPATLAQRLLGGFLPVLDVALRVSGPVDHIIFDRAEIGGVMRCTALAHQQSGAIVTIELTALPRGRAERWQVEHTGTQGRISMLGSGTIEVERWDLEEEPMQPAPRRSEVTVFGGPNRVELSFAAGIAEFGERAVGKSPYSAPLESFIPAIRLAEVLSGASGVVRTSLSGN